MPHDSCSLDLDPIPDRDLFGVKQSAEEESASDSEDSGSGSDTSSVTSKDQKAALETLEYEEPETGEWKLVTRQVLRGRHLSRRKYPFPAVPYLAHAGGTTRRLLSGPGRQANLLPRLFRTNSWSCGPRNTNRLHLDQCVFTSWLCLCNIVIIQHVLFSIF